MTMRNSYSDMVAMNGFGLNIFSEDELYALHYGTLEVLEKTGLLVGLKEARDILGDNGAIVDEKTGIVKIPAYMVEDALQSVPSSIRLYGRHPKNDLVIEGKRVHISTFGQAVKILDARTGELRASVKQDLAEQALLTDAMDSVDICERSLTANDVGNYGAPIHEAEALFPNTTKHTIFGPGNGQRAQKIIDMAAAIVGGHDKLKEKPILTCNCSPTSPLKLDTTVCSGVIVCARNGVPCNLISMVMAGMSGPITMAGSMVVHNAEILGAIVLHQLVRKGAPVIYGGSSMAFDLRLTTTPMGSPECAMLNSALPKVAQFYKVPSFVAGG